eukprot:SM000398S15210  [mRNA]  locus=s398:4289:12937:+ [translate_table: standard]
MTEPARGGYWKPQWPQQHHSALRAAPPSGGPRSSAGASARWPPLFAEPLKRGSRVPSLSRPPFLLLVLLVLALSAWSHYRHWAPGLLAHSEGEISDELELPLDTGSFRLTLQVLASEGAPYLQKLLRSLSVANYDTDRCDLEIYVSPSGREVERYKSRQVLDLLRNFTWLHGDLNIKYWHQSMAGEPLWLEDWWPGQRDYVLLLADSFVLSPHYYVFVKQAVLAYHYSRTTKTPRVYGISLEQVGRMQEEYATGNATSSLFLLQKISRGAQVLFPETWLDFRTWFESQHFDLEVDMLADEAPVFACKDRWLSRYAEYLHSHGAYSLYLDEPSRKMLSVVQEQIDGADPEEDVSEATNLLVQRNNLIGAPTEKWPAVNEMQTYDYCYHRVERGSLAVTDSDLAEMLAHIQVNNTVVSVTANAGFEDVLQNFLCYARGLRIRNYFIIAFEDKLAKNTYEYYLLVLERTKIVGQILHRGFNVLLADTDSVWLSNPFQHLSDARVDVFGQVEPSGDLCGGFLYLRNCRAVIELWDRVQARYEGLVTRITAQMKLIADPAKKASWLMDHRDEHEQKYLNEELRGSNGTVRWRRLDRNLFPSGQFYFLDRSVQAAGVIPVVIHNNWIIGKEAKVARFKEFHLWKIRDADMGCPCARCGEEDEEEEEEEEEGGRGKRRRAWLAAALLLLCGFASQQARRQVSQQPVSQPAGPPAITTLHLQLTAGPCLPCQPLSPQPLAAGVVPQDASSHSVLVQRHWVRIGRHAGSHVEVDDGSKPFVQQERADDAQAASEHAAHTRAKSWWSRREASQPEAPWQASAAGGGWWPWRSIASWKGGGEQVPAAAQAPPIVEKVKIRARRKRVLPDFIKAANSWKFAGSLVGGQPDQEDEGEEYGEDEASAASKKEEPAFVAVDPASKVAICLAGGARDLELSGTSLMEHLIPAYAGAHVFIHTPLDQNTHKISMLRGANIAGVRIFLPRGNLNNTGVLEELIAPGSPSGTTGLLMYYLLVEGCSLLIDDYEEKHGVQFDYVVWTRLDTFWEGRPPPLQDLDSRYYYLPSGKSGTDFGGVNDRLGIGPRKYSQLAMRRHSVLHEVHIRGRRGLGSEGIFQAQLELSNVPVKRADFPFCIPSHRKFEYPPESAAVAPMGTADASNGVYCRPCEPAPELPETVKVKWDLESFCDARGDWMEEWEENFDELAGQVAAKARQYLKARGEKQCLKDMMAFIATVDLWQGFSATGICRRAGNEDQVYR